MWPSPREFDEAAQFLLSGDRFVLAAHRGPDGDAVGSMLGLAGLLESAGKRVFCHGVDPLPYPLRFLSGAERITAELPNGPQWRCVLLDCSTTERAGKAFKAFSRSRPLLIIDHHLGQEPTAQAVLRDSEAAAVGLLIEALAASLGVPTLSAEVAEALYVSIATDTGSFRYSNTSPRALQCCARLIEAGVQPWKISSHLYETEPLARVKLLGDVLQSLQVSPDGTCASLLVSRAMMERWHAGQDLLDGFVNYGRQVEGVEVSVLLREVGTRLHKCSMRSRGRVNVARIAERFGGGGHHNAAGCRVPGDYSEARATLFEAVREELAGCKAS